MYKIHSIATSERGQHSQTPDNILILLVNGEQCFIDFCNFILWELQIATIFISQIFD